MTLHQIFPEPIYISKVERALTKEELQTVDKYKKKTQTNLGNTRTEDSYILDHKALKNLKKDLYKKVIHYFDEVVCTSNSIVPYITQSWINYTEPNQQHPSHSHANSYISGVFYVDAKKGVDRIKFYKRGHQEILLAVSKYNIFNSSTWWYPVQTGDVVLFPSSLIHGVDIKKGTNTRISLSFNVFFKGKIGDDQILTELVL